MPRLLFALLAAAALSAQTRFEYWPSAQYDPAVPTHRQVLGFEPGERISSHAQIVRYMEALAAAMPQRVKLFDYGKTWEGRRLIYAVVASEANMRRLPEIQAGMRKLHDPRQTSDAEARKLISDLPAIVWLTYGVHGNEISSPDAALFTAYHLLAARQDKLVDDILAKTVVIVNPLQNPDGRDRFVHNFEQSEGLVPDANVIAAEHNEPWPSGRTNHYLFDLNRDWFALTQPETRGHVKALQQWYPQVFVDLHEMGTESSYYFAPEAVPYNPHLAKDQRDSLEWFGKNNAKWFDEFGFNYFTREVFDAFYPGYGASWPSYFGSIAMTYENGSTRGLVVRRSDDTTITFRETVRRHFISSISTCETAARRREDLLRNFYRYQQTALEEGANGPIKAFVLPYRGDRSAVDKLVGLLLTQGVEVQRAAAAVTFNGQTVPAGSYVVPLSQPGKRLIRTLLDPQVSMDDKFLKAEEQRRRGRRGTEIYDVTAWSVPLQFNIEAVASNEVVKGNLQPVSLESLPAGSVTGGTASVAYLVPWGTGSAGRLLASLLREGVRLSSTDRPFIQNGRSFPSGTLIVKVKDNSPQLADTMQRLSRTTGAEVVATNTGWVEDGPNFGSRWVLPVKPLQIAMAWDAPTASGSAGHTRYVLERQFGYPVTTIRTQQMGLADLNHFQVLILPDGLQYIEVLGPAGIKRIKDWVGNGGTLIGIGRATTFLSDPRVGLLATAQETLARPGEPPKPAGPPVAPPSQDPRTPGRILQSPEEFEKSTAPDTILPDFVPGVLVRAKVDSDHWLAAGVSETVTALVAGNSIYTPLKADRGNNVAVFFGSDRLLASGYLWEENRKQLAYKPLVLTQREGRGNIIAFTADPNYRAYLDGLNLLFLNAIFRGPSHASVAQAEQLE